jgi:hypothetical protein
MKVIKPLLKILAFAVVLLIVFMIWIARSTEKANCTPTTSTPSQVKAENTSAQKESESQEGGGIAVDPDSISKTDSTAALNQDLTAPLGEGPGAPRIEKVTARGLNMVPGALICPKLSMVSAVFRMYSMHWRGESSVLPNPSDYGCALVAPGTPMIVQKVDDVRAVSVRLNNGTIFKGVTLADMIVETQTDLDSDHEEWKAKVSKQLDVDQNKQNSPSQR